MLNRNIGSFPTAKNVMGRILIDKTETDKKSELSNVCIHTLPGMISETFNRLRRENLN